MNRNEEASDPLNNKLETQSLPSFSTIVGMGDRILVFFISSCVTEYTLNWAFFGTKIM